MSRKNKSSQQIDQLVGSRVRFFRLQRGFSQHILAQQLGISYQQLHKYECGDNSVSASRLAEISHALQVDISALFVNLHDADDEQTSGNEECPLLDREQSIVLSYMNRIKHPEKRRAIMDLIHSLSAQEA